MVGLGVVLAVFAGLRGSLPSPLATHFASGSADDATGRTGFVVLCVVLFLGMGALFGGTAAWARTGGRALSGWAGIGYACAGLLCYLLAALLFANAGTAGGEDVSFPAWHLGVGAAVALGAAALGVLLARLLRIPAGVGSRSAAEGTGAGEPRRLPLSPHETAGWTSRTSSLWLASTGCTVLAAGVVLAALGEWASGGPVLLAGLTVLAVSSPRVTVDRHGLTVTFGFLAWPRLRVGLSQVERADARKIKATDFGGWGYRVTPRGSGVILRSGEAIVVRRKDGREFAVTVRGADTAAALLNSLAARDSTAE